MWDRRTAWSPLWWWPWSILGSEWDEIRRGIFSTFSLEVFRWLTDCVIYDVFGCWSFVRCWSFEWPVNVVCWAFRFARAVQSVTNDTFPFYRPTDRLIHTHYINSGQTHVSRAFTRNTLGRIPLNNDHFSLLDEAICVQLLEWYY